MATFPEGLGIYKSSYSLETIPFLSTIMSTLAAASPCLEIFSDYSWVSPGYTASNGKVTE